MIFKAISLRAIRSCVCLLLPVSGGMAKPYSLDLRERIFAAWQRGEGTQAQVAVRFGVSERCVRGLVRRQRESGSVAAKAHGGGAVALATPEKLATLEAQVAAHNDHTIAEHHQGLLAAGHRQSAATVGRWLLGLGLTRKKDLQGRRGQHRAGPGPAGGLARAGSRHRCGGLRVHG